ncbi:MAG: flagellin [Rhodospirillales bacterium]|nr:flagellin [Rhodospirillales bacterium]
MSILNSVNTNYGATVALEALNNTTSQLNAVQKQVSTGYIVADATDNGAAFAVAQRVRSDVSALSTSNQVMGGVQGLLSTTLSGLTTISNTLTSMRNVLVNLASASTQGTTRTQYEAQYNSLLSNVKTFIQDAGYNGMTLIGNISGSNGTFGRVSVVTNEVGQTYGVATFGGSALHMSLSFTSTQLGSSTTVATLITSTGTFINKFNSVGTELNTYGASINFINNQISYNSNKIDALNNGLGSLVDANLAQESALLQSLQIKQQLATQSLTIADQAPSILLKLFP